MCYILNTIPVVSAPLPVGEGEGNHEDHDDIEGEGISGERGGQGLRLFSTHGAYLLVTG